MTRRDRPLGETGLVSSRAHLGGVLNQLVRDRVRVRILIPLRLLRLILSTHAAALPPGETTLRPVLSARNYGPDPRPMCRALRPGHAHRCGSPRLDRVLSTALVGPVMLLHLASPVLEAFGEAHLQRRGGQRADLALVEIGEAIDVSRTSDADRS